MNFYQCKPCEGLGWTKDSFACKWCKGKGYFKETEEDNRIRKVNQKAFDSFGVKDGKPSINL